MCLLHFIFQVHECKELCIHKCYKYIVNVLINVIQDQFAEKQVFIFVHLTYFMLDVLLFLPGLTDIFLFLFLFLILSNLFVVIFQDTVFCKAILNEFALKMNLDKPTFNTVQQERLLPVFISSSVFNGVCYTSTHGQNKKEAERLAARAVIISLLGIFSFLINMKLF